MSEDYILLALTDAVRRALSLAADYEIEKQKRLLEKELVAVKNKAIGEMVNNIRIAASQRLPNNEYIIQIVLKGGDT